MALGVAVAVGGGVAVDVAVGFGVAVAIGSGVATGVVVGFGVAVAGSGVPVGAGRGVVFTEAASGVGGTASSAQATVATSMNDAIPRTTVTMSHDLQLSVPVISGAEPLKGLAYSSKSTER